MSLSLANTHRPVREIDRDTTDLAHAVASSLGVSGNCVVIGNEKCIWDDRSIKFTGHADGQEFFAKMLLVDPYPVTVAVPWQRLLVASGNERAAASQVKLEASAKREIGRSMDVGAIAECMGSSVPLRAIVWERLNGTSALALLRRSRVFDPLGKTCRAIAFEAGVWLKRLHAGTQRGSEELRPGAAIDAVVQEIANGKRSAAAGHAITLLRRCGEKLSCSLPVTVSRNHGDFTLVNLMWDQQLRRLYVTDFENSEDGPAWQDLAAITFSLRKQMLNPMIPAAVVEGMEQSFWSGYGEIDPALFEFVQTLAISRILVRCPERISNDAGKSWTRGIAGSLYASFVQTKLIPRAVPGFCN